MYVMRSGIGESVWHMSGDSADQNDMSYVGKAWIFYGGPEYQ